MTKASNLQLIDRLQFPWLTATIAHCSSRKMTNQIFNFKSAIIKPETNISPKIHALHFAVCQLSQRSLALRLSEYQSVLRLFQNVNKTPRIQLTLNLQAPNACLCCQYLLHCQIRYSKYRGKLCLHFNLILLN